MIIVMVCYCYEIVVFLVREKYLKIMGWWFWYVIEEICVINVLIDDQEWDLLLMVIKWCFIGVVVVLVVFMVGYLFYIFQLVFGGFVVYQVSNMFFGGIYVI